ncbi:MAG TPA: hypothetical protein VGX25_06125 [Actinophytocola sp.]|uniref:hypothetical protein n=1 Tax=Actinophytocola sp. TaxID=1872138 RepID=UPI002DDC9F6B|nr:hypothetical protein [Actinophytocola sp.]HEV2778963.1 hypothetical protein [Actinophytocola sp.]
MQFVGEHPDPADPVPGEGQRVDAEFGDGAAGGGERAERGVPRADVPGAMPEGDGESSRRGDSVDDVDHVLVERGVRGAGSIDEVGERRPGHR